MLIDPALPASALSARTQPSASRGDVGAQLLALVALAFSHEVSR